MTRWVTRRLDVLADRSAAVALAGWLLIAAEFVGVLGLLAMYR